MVIKGSFLRVIDNSGAKVGKCIQVINKSNKGRVGDIILLTLKKFRKGIHKVKKKIIYLGIIATTKFWDFKKDGFFLKFFSNSVLLFNLQFKFVGTRILGVLNRNIKSKVYIFKNFKFSFKLLNYSCYTL